MFGVSGRAWSGTGEAGAYREGEGAAGRGRAGVFFLKRFVSPLSSGPL